MSTSPTTGATPPHRSAGPAPNPAVTTVRAQIAKIKMAQKALGMDESSYRAVLVRITGKDSSARMSIAQREAVLVEMKRLGWTPAPGKAQRRRPKDTGQVPMLTKVEALLAQAGRPWTYAHGLAKRMFKVDRLEFLTPDQLRRLVAALQIDANRRSA